MLPDQQMLFNVLDQLSTLQFPVIEVYLKCEKSKDIFLKQVILEIFIFEFKYCGFFC